MVDKNKKIIGFTCGAFDITHAGHYLMFKECHEQCDTLIVGLQINPNIDRKEKNKPVQTLKERRIQLEACKYIDKIITYKTEKDLYHLLKKLKPDIRFIGIDWKDKPNYSRDKLPEIKVIYNSRNHNYSSSALRARILKAK
ncbi:MAG: glycerol-3-phosphate cytidylyltransferase [Patescibacteria group bacterium]|nr:glycerol-3-phosphate cytidylyltransferase [Patescibacteria group bacterium]MDQ5971374.1 glycerol-3-phosphate cytidylyltransferase [Patescibacteria group bacterium]